jgi:hypothetical protein
MHPQLSMIVGEKRGDTVKRQRNRQEPAVLVIGEFDARDAPRVKVRTEVNRVATQKYVSSVFEMDEADLAPGRVAANEEEQDAAVAEDIVIAVQ